MWQDEGKVAAIALMPIPKTLTQLRSFIGMVQYHRRFIQNVSVVIKPLTDLTSKSFHSVAECWDEKADVAFVKIKQLLAELTHLVIFDAAKDHYVVVDGSMLGIGAGLYQQIEEQSKKFEPVAFMSQKVSEKQNIWPAHEIELLAVVEARKYWRHWLQSKANPTMVYTDSTTVKYYQDLIKLPNATGKIARQLIHISQYNLIFQHIKGKLNGVTDCLSREPVGTAREVAKQLFCLHAGTVCDDASLPVTEGEELIICSRPRGAAAPSFCMRPVGLGPPVYAITRASTHSAWESSIASEEIPAVKVAEPVIFRTLYLPPRESGLPTAPLTQGRFQVAYMVDPEWKDLYDREDRLKWEGFKQMGVYVIQESKIVVPAGLEEPLLQEIHAHTHYGVSKTIQCVCRRWHIEGLRHWDEHICKDSDRCTRAKTNKQGPPANNTVWPMVRQKWQEIAIDFIEGLPNVVIDDVVYDKIVVVKDRATMYHELIPASRYDTAEVTWMRFRDRIIARYGYPKLVSTDNNDLYATFERMHPVLCRAKSGVPRNHTANGYAENAIRNDSQCCRLMMEGEHALWYARLPNVQGVLNAQPVTSDEGGSPVSPEELLFGFPPIREGDLPSLELLDPESVVMDENHTALMQTHSRLLSARVEAGDLSRAKLREKLERNKQWKRYEVGNWVWLSTKSIKGKVVEYGPYKWQDRWCGPFRIMEVTMLATAVRIKLPAHWRISEWVNVKQMRPYCATLSPKDGTFNVRPRGIKRDADYDP